MLDKIIFKCKINIEVKKSQLILENLKKERNIQ